jgi:hypothetical protein
MATIFTRTTKDGSTTYRVQFRRKGVKPFCGAFSSREEAEEFCRKNEESHCFGKEIEYNTLEKRRFREFCRKKDVRN